MYIDADNIGLSSPVHLFHKLRWYEMVQYTWATEGEFISMGALGPYRARTQFTSTLVSKHHKKFNEKFGERIALVGFVSVNYVCMYERIISFCR